jgi:hypothetical protein
MRIPRWLGATGIAVSALALFAGVGFGAASASTASPRPAAHAVSAGITAPAKKAHAYWQGPYTYTVQTGLTNLFFHYSCPRKFPTAVSGAFHYMSEPGPQIGMSAPRTDIKPFYTQWGWVFIWPSGGAAAGFQIQFNVYCLAK